MRRNDNLAPIPPSGRQLTEGTGTLCSFGTDAPPTVCSPASTSRCCRCGAVHRDGEWHWSHAALEAQSSVQCPACARIADHMPAGRLLLQGAVVARHGVDLVRIALQEAERERSRHPLRRVIEAVNHSDHCIELTTTDLELPLRMAEAVRRRHGGELHVDYGKAHRDVRVRWCG
jgi:hypothetical protein